MGFSLLSTEKGFSSFAHISAFDIQFFCADSLADQYGEKG